MKDVLSISLGELVLKGGNRKYFEDKLIKQIIKAVREFGYDRLYKEQGKIYIEADKEKFPSMINRLRKVFGIVYISPCVRVEKKMEDIDKAVIVVMREKIERDNPKTFKAMAKRTDKNFPIKSPELSRLVGGTVLKNFEAVKVDIHNPDAYIYVDVKDYAYVYTERVKGSGGMPLATNGRGLLLLSGGIDSPVAGYMMAKRGIEISAIHYHSYPFTSDRAEEKVKDLASILSMYTGKITLYSVNLLEIQKEINKNCPASEMTILSRRFMMRIAEAVAGKHGIDSLITGENLGQVASQTMHGLIATNDAIDLPVFRPLIGFDKIDIINIAKDIETYETSILPFEDCCTVFLPKKPVTKPRVEDIRKSENLLEIDELVARAIEKMDIYTVE